MVDDREELCRNHNLRIRLPAQLTWKIKLFDPRLSIAIAGVEVPLRMSLAAQLCECMEHLLSRSDRVLRRSP